MNSSVLSPSQKYFPGKEATRKIHRKQYPGPELLISHIIISDDNDAVTFRFFAVVCTNSQLVYIIKQKITLGLEDINFIFSS